MWVCMKTVSGANDVEARCNRHQCQERFIGYIGPSTASTPMLLARQSVFGLFSLVSLSIELSTEQVYPDVLYEP